jgi:carbonic anhydrase
MRRTIIFALAGFELAILLQACTSASATTETTVSASSTTLPHWTYEGEEGPDNWGEMSEAYVLCADGSAQTPIDITDTEEMAILDPTFAYEKSPALIFNNGHTIEAEAEEGNSVSVHGARSALKQIHFHAPSEHTIDEVSYAAEVHFVHKTEAGEITVVGVLIEEGPKANAAWQPYIDGMGLSKDEEIETTIDWEAMLPESHMTYRYTGSLTTPPCTEGVHWMLMETPVQLSAEQIAAMTDAYEGNNRPVQDTNGRVIEMDTSSN